MYDPIGGTIVNYRYSGRPPKRRITGRFYAFLTVLMVLVVLLFVMISSKMRAPQANANAPVYDPNSAVVQTAPPAVVVQPTESAQVVASDPNAQSRSADTQQPADTLSADASDQGQPGVQIGDGIEGEANRQQDAALIERAKARTDLPEEWVNILLLGSDSRDMSKIVRTRCDTIMIVSVNKATGQLKMCSIMRDTMIEVPDKGMVKINSVPEIGGMQLMISLINENFGLNITDYAIVNFAGMANIVDILDGVYLDIDKDEAKEINTHMGEIAVFTMSQEEYLSHREEWKIKNWGKDSKLSGIQAVTYARIRVIDSDHNRTLRQRKLIMAIMERVKGAGLIKLSQTVFEALNHVETTVSFDRAFALGMAVLNCKLETGKVKDWRIPTDGKHAKYEKRNGSEAFYDVDYPLLTELMYKFIYTDAT